MSISIFRRISKDELNAATQLIWLDRSVANKITLDTIELITIAYNKKSSFFYGRSSRFIISGLFYILGFRYDSIKKQVEIADRLGTSDVTVRASYRKWMETFPELFCGEIAKFSMDISLRDFVILKIKRSRECFGKI
jgi:hypothetical protein